jgi:hypothetical protein
MKKYLTPQNIFKQERQIKDAVWVNGQFILTRQEVIDIVEQSKYENKVYKNQMLMKTKALELIEMFKIKVTPKVWTKWVNWNKGDDRIANIVNLFNEMYNDGDLEDLTRVSK